MRDQNGPCCCGVHHKKWVMLCILIKLSRNEHDKYTLMQHSMYHFSVLYKACKFQTTLFMPAYTSSKYQTY
jgi:hypothetical protein